MSGRTEPVMIQGTVSNAGEDILAAGLYRIFHQNSYRTTPLKFQGMALNFYITPEELEMGRAQITQAKAAGIVPHVDTNPILLKPATDVGSQVTVHGIPRGNMRARDYFAYKKSLAPDIMASYRRPEEQYDAIVIEGAGSPAEINLRFYGIVSMSMADMADAPMFLVGDIDRDGVFAQLYGTVSLLAEKGGKRVRGLIINKSRGDRSMLEPGIPMLEALHRMPVVGVISYMDMDIENEDSLSNRPEIGKSKAPAAADLAVVRFPRISNFTDFNVFPGILEVLPRYATKARNLSSPDMVILPDTKNTIQDLLRMRQNGLEATIFKLADRQVPVWRICGGYQMIGEVLEDAMGVESGLPSWTVGMGLLPLKTESEKEKVRTQAEGVFSELDGRLCGLFGKSIEGYKIHIGHTYTNREGGAADTTRAVSWRRGPGIRRLTDYVMETGKDRILSRQARMDGWNRGNIYGTYVHGILDSPQMARTMVEALAITKGLCLEQTADMNYRAYREQQYDKLTESLRGHLDMDTVYRIMGISLKEKGEEKLGGGYTVGTGTAGKY